MFRLVDVRPLSAHRLFLRYDNGVEGEVDISNLVGRGVFARLSDPREFENVAIGSSGEVRWNDELDLCPDALYLVPLTNLWVVFGPKAGRALDFLRHRRAIE